MSDIAALEARITAALDKIRRGLDGMAVAATPVAPVADQSDEVAALRAKLDEEKTANAQLEERVKTLKARQDDTIRGLELKANAASGMETEIQRLRQSNADLRELNAQLRSAAAEGSAAPELINRAMQAEIEALEAQRKAESAEVDAIITALKPIVEGA